MLNSGTPCTALLLAAEYYSVIQAVATQLPVNKLSSIQPCPGSMVMWKHAAIAAPADLQMLCLINLARTYACVS